MILYLAERGRNSFCYQQVALGLAVTTLVHPVYIARAVVCAVINESSALEAGFQTGTPARSTGVLVQFIPDGPT